MIHLLLIALIIFIYFLIGCAINYTFMLHDNDFYNDDAQFMFMLCFWPIVVLAIVLLIIPKVLFGKLYDCMYNRVKSKKKYVKTSHVKS